MSACSSGLRLAALALLGFLLAYVVVVPPHLVHHAFEEGDEHHHGDQPPCPHLALGQQTAEVSSGSPVVLVRPAASAGTLVLVRREAPAPPEVSGQGPRAPPLA